jgi:hypothetical protein
MARAGPLQDHDGGLYRRGSRAPLAGDPARPFRDPIRPSAIALTGLYFGRYFDVEASEGWFQLASAVIILRVAAWMMFATRREQNAVHNEHDHHHDHEYDPTMSAG